jgi:predicted small integral membrane protein
MIEGAPDFLFWMYWTFPSVIFFGGIFLSILCLGVWHRHSPSIARKGFLPIETTRGDRLFIGVISSIFIYLIWMAVFKLSLLIVATILVVVWLILLAWKG